MAKRKKRRVKRDKRVPIIATAGLVAGASTVNRSGGLDQIVQGNVQEGVKRLSRELIIGSTGYDTETKSWNFTRLFDFYGPMVLGVLGSTAATKLGINRRIKNVPIVGKYIKL